MADQNTSSSTPQASTSTPTQAAQQPVASTSTAPQAGAQPTAAATNAASATIAQGQPAINTEMLAIVQALVKMQNGGQIDPALSQNAAVQHLCQLVKSGKLNQQQLLQVHILVISAV